MVLSPVAIITSNLGMHVLVYEISKKEKFRRKKYMGGLQVSIYQGECDDNQIASDA